MSNFYDDRGMFAEINVFDSFRKAVKGLPMEFSDEYFDLGNRSKWPEYDEDMFAFKCDDVLDLVKKTEHEWLQEVPYANQECVAGNHMKVLNIDGDEWNGEYDEESFMV